MNKNTVKKGVVPYLFLVLIKYIFLSKAPRFCFFVCLTFSISEYVIIYRYFSCKLRTYALYFIYARSFSPRSIHWTHGCINSL